MYAQQLYQQELLDYRLRRPTLCTRDNSSPTTHYNALKLVLFAGYSNTLARIRRAKTGIRRSHFFLIIVIGDMGENVRIKDIVKVTGENSSSICNKMRVVVRDKFIAKTGNKYYLTDTGKGIYQIINAGFEQTYQNFKAQALKELKDKL